MTLPPLPEPVCKSQCSFDVTNEEQIIQICGIASYTATQMRVYGEACAAAERECTATYFDRLQADGNLYEASAVAYIIRGMKP